MYRKFTRVSGSDTTCKQSSNHWRPTSKKQTIRSDRIYHPKEFTLDFSYASIFTSIFIIIISRSLKKKRVGVARTTKKGEATIHHLLPAFIIQPGISAHVRQTCLAKSFFTDPAREKKRIEETCTRLVIESNAKNRKFTVPRVSPTLVFYITRWIIKISSRWSHYREFDDLHGGASHSNAIILALDKRCPSGFLREKSRRMLLKNLGKSEYNGFFEKYLGNFNLSRLAKI